jgi:hypothetical protein
MRRQIIILFVFQILLTGLFVHAEDSKQVTTSTTNQTSGATSGASASTTTTLQPEAAAKPTGPDAQWSALCTLKGKSVSLEVQSKSGDPFEDDMQVTLKMGFKKTSVPKLKALFRSIPPSKRFQLCDKTMGLSVEKTKMLILLAKDDRPALEELVAILVDPMARKVLDVNRNLGAFFREPPARALQFERTPTGFRAMVVQGFNRNSLSDSAEDLVTGWVNVSVKNGKISAKWEKTLPETHGVYSTPNVSAPGDSSKK